MSVPDGEDRLRLEGPGVGELQIWIPDGPGLGDPVLKLIDDVVEVSDDTETEPANALASCSVSCAFSCFSFSSSSESESQIFLLFSNGPEKIFMLCFGC